MPQSGSDSPENRPGSMKKSGISALENRCYDCIFIHYRPSFCINIQSRVSFFYGSRHGYNNDGVCDTSHGGHGGNKKRPPCHRGHEDPEYWGMRGVTRRTRSNGARCSTKYPRPYGSAWHRHWVSAHSRHRYLSGCRASGGSTHDADS